MLLLFLLFSGYNSLAVANLGLQSASEESSTEKSEKPEKPEKDEKDGKFEKEGTEVGLVAVEKTENKFWDVEQLATSVSKKRNPF